eukprot:TRINITY_DN27358_c0_g1_i1.p1 TRINITY_DN27358_c0_g1~~TRINITY_DN27358_c0_g1_i1.p1  ORF type:complete len:624 (-),score=124.17 TRINITY_DN27358_c0_g1_i1:10-1881(-)
MEASDAKVAEEVPWSSTASINRSRSSVIRKVTDWRDGRLTRRERLQFVARRFVSHPKFEAFISTIIVVNALTIGVGQSIELETGKPSAGLDTLDNVLLGFYTLELCLRFFGYGIMGSLQDRWVWLDLLLVVTGILSDWVLKYAASEVEELSPLMVLRSLRLLRLVRALKMLMTFRELSLLVNGLISSAGMMFYVLLLLGVILYIFACMAMELITKHGFAQEPDKYPHFAGIVDSYFNSIPTAMLTLLQFVCMDSIGMIYKPLVEQDWLIGVYFVVVILVVSIVLMNLVAAVIINSAMEQALQDKQMLKDDEARKRKKMVQDLNEMFHRIDEDGSGELTKDELTEASDADKAFIFSCTDIEDPLEFFDMVDVDKTGAVDIDEFCEGIWQAVVSKAPIEVRRMEKVINSVRKEVKACLKAQRETVKMLRLLLPVEAEKSLSALHAPSSLGSDISDTPSEVEHRDQISNPSTPSNRHQQDLGTPRVSKVDDLTARSIDITILETLQALLLEAHSLVECRLPETERQLFNTSSALHRARRPSQQGKLAQSPPKRNSGKPSTIGSLQRLVDHKGTHAVEEANGHDPQSWHPGGVASDKDCCSSSNRSRAGSDPVADSFASDSELGIRV